MAGHGNVTSNASHFSFLQVGLGFGVSNLSGEVVWFGCGGGDVDGMAFGGGHGLALGSVVVVSCLTGVSAGAGKGFGGGAGGPALQLGLGLGSGVEA